jgi:UDP-N-acetylmuramoylalanine--D-glutamate ligase
MDPVSYFKGKKITVMGLGLLGRGVGDAAFLAEAGAELIVTDLKTEAQLAHSLEKLQAYPNIRFTLGKHAEEDFEGRDMILVAAGVPFDSPYLLYAKKAGARLVQSAALFAELSKVPMIGITGTRGKSTTTAMIAHIIETATGEHVIKGGNIRGVSNLQLLKEVTDDSLAVFELDSWQLQGFGWAGISPQVAVFTTFMDDHLNYYKGDIDAYFADKANIFINQEDDGVFITTPEVFERAKRFAAHRGITLGQEVVLVDDSMIPEDAVLSMPGAHNRLNAALALAACRSISLSDDEIFDALASFPGVEGRLQLLAIQDGVKIYNDNNATTPQATIAGMEALDGGDRNIVLLAGGADKEIDITSLARAIATHCKSVSLLPGSGTDRLLPLLHDAGVDVFVSPDLHSAFNEAKRHAVAGDILLFSPAFASFGLFVNEYDRNDQFVALVQAAETDAS